MRELFGDWGAELSDEDFACALVAGGLVGRGSTAEDFVLELMRLTRFIPMPWHPTGTMLRLDARALAEAWRRFLRSTGPVPIRIDPQFVRESGVDVLGWLLRQFSLAGVHLGGEGSWDSPTRSLPRKRVSYAVDGDLESLEHTGEAPPRFLQARVTPSRQESRVAVRIGLPDERWAAVERPFPRLSATETYRLTVIFWEPAVSPEPQIGHLLLPPRGNSEEVLFPFQPAGSLESFAARITVLHNNRVLQTGLLRMQEGRWTFRLDATPRLHLEGLSGRTEFDAALVLNHDGEGIPRLTAAAGDQAVVLALDDGPLAELTRFLKTHISEIADQPERYTTLSSPGTVELLRTLAQKGGALHEHLCEHTDLAVLADARRVHLSSAKAGSFFPIELLYRFEPPEDTAGLCPNASTALQTGECPGGCPADKRQHVCPLGFWGLSRVIERHAHRREDQKIDGDFLLQPEPVRARSPLPLSSRSLLAASARASQVKSDAVDTLHRNLGRRGTALRATTWEEWTGQVSSWDPTLLVLLPHHEQVAGEEVLEIGNGARLKSELVRIDHVRRKDGPYPVVLLLGCETNLARIAFDNFVTRFRDKGAAVVVSTIATILGRHASPAAAHLVELLDEEAREGESTFGEVMVRLRRKLLEVESPMALGLTAYGDADWILTRIE